MGHNSEIVKIIIEKTNIQNSGKMIILDNKFVSVPLFEWALENNVFLVGTMNIRRRFKPKVMNKKYRV